MGAIALYRFCGLVSLVYKGVLEPELGQVVIRGGTLPLVKWRSR